MNKRGSIAADFTVRAAAVFVFMGSDIISLFAFCAEIPVIFSVGSPFAVGNMLGFFGLFTLGADISVVLIVNVNQVFKHMLSGCGDSCGLFSAAYTAGLLC